MKIKAAVITHRLSGLGLSPATEKASAHRHDLLITQDFGLVVLWCMQCNCYWLTDKAAGRATYWTAIRAADRYLEAA